MSIFKKKKNEEYTIVVGCGRLGSKIANTLSEKEANVLIIDKSNDSFRRLSSEYGGLSVVGDGMDIEELHDPEYRGFYAEVILHSSKSGVFKGLKLDPQIEPMVVEKDLWVENGDTVEAFTGANKTIGTLVVNFPSMQECRSRLENLSSWLEVCVE